MCILNHVILSVIILTVIASVLSSASKILFLPFQFRSHMLEELVLGEELVARGHEVYMVIGSRYPDPESINKLGITTLPFHVPDDVLFAISEEFERDLGRLIFSSDNFDAKLAEESRMVEEIASRNCALFMGDTKFMDAVKEVAFDLVIVDAFIVAPCNLILPYTLNIPFISMTGAVIPWHFRIPTFPSFIASPSPWKSVDKMTFVERFKNLIGVATWVSGLIYPSNTTLLEQYKTGMKSWHELLRKSELVITTRDYHLGTFLPTMPNYVNLPGLTARPAKPLPPELEKWAVENKYGIILASFGSTAHYIPEAIVKKFITAFKGLNQTVVVKLAISEGLDVPKNVKIVNWFPQNDILGHKQTKLFITHCGNNGQHEALYHGVPMIGFPLFGEQAYNCLRACQMGFGLELDIHTFSSDQLRATINDVITNPKYRRNIERMSDSWRDQPLTPRERGVFLVEHILKYGGDHLRSAAMDMPLHEFLMLDIIAALYAVFLVISLFVVWIISFVVKQYCQASKKVKQN